MRTAKGNPQASNDCHPNSSPIVQHGHLRLCRNPANFTPSSVPARNRSNHKPLGECAFIGDYRRARWKTACSYHYPVSGDLLLNDGFRIEQIMG
jgi:hypothetical protein